MGIQQGYVYLKLSGFTNIIKTLWGGMRLFDAYFQKYNIRLPLIFNCDIWNLVEQFYSIDYQPFSVKDLDYKNLKILHIRDAESAASLAGTSLTDYIHTCEQTTLHFYKQYTIPPAVFFNRFKLQPTAAALIKEKQEQINGPYVAVHIRGGDYVCKYQSYEQFITENSRFLEKVILENSDKKILLCTDDQAILSKYVDNSKVFSFSINYELLQKKCVVPADKSLHTSLHLLQDYNISNYDVCLSTFLDFYLLVYSSKLHTNQHNYSTYAEMALQLNDYARKHSIDF